MIKLFVFDLGNVILPFEHRQIVYKLHEVSRVAGRFSPDEIFRYMFDMENGLINAYEEGLMSSLDFFVKLKERYKLEIDFEEFKDIWNPIFREDPEVNDIILYLKGKGYPLFLLSNTNELHFTYITELYPIVHLMEEWILSFEIGAKKPKQRIYDEIFKRTDVKRSEILFIDDIKRYVETAIGFGLQGIVFKQAGDLWKVIKENLI
ncbi:MAG: HAD family phosphatase [Syntrophorhabdaceae bacterium]|nr:HAD family phosphatase [Syntrophorhabdaceae bacterium]MDD5244592.1 HAD family phosphatase [Syntrophorhabdaceae bacterium]